MQYFYMSGLKSLEHAAYTHHLNYSDECEYMEPERRQYYMKDYKPHGPGSYIQKELAKLGEKFPHFADICYNQQKGGLLWKTKYAVFWIF